MKNERCFCGMDSHLDQMEKYPVGTKVKLKEECNTGTYGLYSDCGVVTDHCDDGRACIDVIGCIHTFHHLDSYVESFTLPPSAVVNRKEVTIEELRQEIATQAAEIERLEIAAKRVDGMLTDAINEIGALKAQLAETWQPVVDGNVVIPKLGIYKGLGIDGYRLYITQTNGQEDSIYLRDTLRLCERGTR